MSIHILFGLLAILFFALGILMTTVSAFEDIKWSTNRFIYDLKPSFKWIIGFTIGVIGEVLFLLITIAI